jgi:hypothetical protein
MILMSSSLIILSIISIYFILYEPEKISLNALAITIIIYSCFSLLEFALLIHYIELILSSVNNNDCYLTPETSFINKNEIINFLITFFFIPNLFLSGLISYKKKFYIKRTSMNNIENENIDRLLFGLTVQN